MSQYPKAQPFLKAIAYLLETNQLVLFGRIDAVPSEELEAVLVLLKKQLKEEQIGYPGPNPKWDPDAAGWAAKVLFNAAQLLLYRSHEADELADYFPDFSQPISATALISADCCLRFLPSIIRQLEALDVDDELIPVLQEVLRKWHYSGLLAATLPEPESQALVLEDECLRRLYVNRIIKTKNNTMAARPEFQKWVLAALGNYAANYWPELDLDL